MVDSGASLSKSMLKKYNIVSLPYNVTFKNGDSYRDVYDIKNLTELKRLIDMHGDLPKIDQVSKTTIENYFRKLIDNGDDILYIGVSSKLSSAYNEVLEVSKKFDSSTIEVIDSLNVGNGEALLALFAKDYINRGYGLRQTTKYLNEIKYKIKSCYAIGNANYLYSQNRCKEIYDKFLEFYHRIPVGEINNGKIYLTFSAKESELALQVLKNTISDYSMNMNRSHMIISYSGDKHNALKLKEFTNKVVNGITIELVENSSVVFTSSGDNSIGIAFLIDKK